MPSSKNTTGDLENNMGVEAEKIVAELSDDELLATADALSELDPEDIELKKIARKAINDLPDSDFAYIEPGGRKDKTGRTVPRSLRHLPIHDAAHVRSALSRLPQTDIPAAAKKKAAAKIRRAAKKFGVTPAKTKKKSSLKGDRNMSGTKETANLIDELKKKYGDNEAAAPILERLSAAFEDDITLSTDSVEAFEAILEQVTSSSAQMVEMSAQVTKLSDTLTQQTKQIEALTEERIKLSAERRTAEVKQLLGMLEDKFSPVVMSKLSAYFNQPSFSASKVSIPQFDDKNEIQLADDGQPELTEVSVLQMAVDLLTTVAASPKAAELTKQVTASDTGTSDSDIQGAMLRVQSFDKNLMDQNVNPDRTTEADSSVC